MNIAIMGASSHIAKNLIIRFAAAADNHLTLFCRNAQSVAEFVRCYAENGNIRIVTGYNEFNDFEFDVIINCVGAGVPGVAGFDIRNWFDVTAKFDELALNYLEKRNPQAILIAFSSGAVYGTRSKAPFAAESCYLLPVNNIEVSDYYSIARIHSEARHRCRKDLRIVDLRIFSFFSCFVKPDSGYFMSDVLKAVAGNSVLITRQSDMVRDYVSPDDLFDIIKLCIAAEKINGAFDVQSAAPAGKFEILEAFQKKFGLKWQFDKVADSPNGDKSIYTSQYASLQKLGFVPRFTSLESLITETEKYLNSQGKQQ